MGAVWPIVQARQPKDTNFNKSRTSAGVGKKLLTSPAQVDKQTLLSFS